MRDYWTQMNNAYLRAVEQVADRMHNGNQNQQQYSKDKPGRSPKENMEVIVAIEDKPSENDI